MKVYFISGLAADRRAFKNIHLPQGFEPVYLDWIPAKKNESLQSYALKLAAPIDRGEPYILVGLSLGGMIATEIAQKYPPRQLVLISSISGYSQLPAYFKWVGRMKIHKVVPVSLLKSASLLKRFLTSEAIEDKTYLRQAIKDSDPAFIKWAINAILTWRTECTGEHFHIHGARDLLLPLRYIKPTHVVREGGHMMVLTKGKEISQMLQEIFTSNSTNLPERGVNK